MTLKDNLKRERKLRNLSQPELARRAGVRQQVISDIESGRVKKPRNLPEIAAALGIDVDQLIPERINRSVIDKAPSVLYGGADLPLFGAAEGGGGSLIVSSDPVQYIERPAPLAGVRDSYAMYVRGESMAPAYEPGDTALVNPHLPPTPGKVCIFYQTDGGDSVAMIKRLVKITPKEWVVCQFNPDGEFSLDRTQWPQCHVVIGKYNR